MPPLIRRSQSAVPGTPAGTAVTQALGPTRRLDMTPPVMLRARLFEHIPLREYGEPEEFGLGGRVRAIPRRVPHHRRDDPGGRRCHQLDLSTRSRAKPPGPRRRGI